MGRVLLLQRFDTLADSPDAVEKLRKLVFDLAIRGYLVPQNQKDDPAIQLVQRAEAVLAKERKKGNGSQVVPPFSLPTNWCWTCLDELGDTAPKNELDDKTEVGFSPMRLVTAKFGEPISFEHKAWSEVRKGFTHFADGDVVVAKITPCFQNGKSGVIRRAPNGFGAGTTELHVLRPVANCVLPDYVLIFVKSPHFLINGEAYMTGTAGQKRVPWDYFARTRFPLPPFAEQGRIVAKVDQLLALCDELEARQTAAREHRTRLVRSALDHLTTAKDEAEFKKHSAFCLQHSELLFDSVPALRRAILSLAVQGHLVPRCKEEGTAETLLKEAGAVTITPEDAPFIPAHWNWACLGDLVTRMDSGWSPACPAEPASKNQWGVLKTTAVQTLRYLEHENKALPENLEPRPENEVMQGDILITRAGPKNRVGISCVVESTRPRLMISDKIVRFHLYPLVDSKFAALCLNAGYSSVVLERLKSGMAESQMNISQGKFKTTPLPIPPLAEQQRIVAKVDELMRWCDALEARLTAAQSTATHLLDAALHGILNHQS